MKLKKASVWFYNKSSSNVVIADLNIVIRRGDVVDLFAIKPNLSYDAYLKSEREGSIKNKLGKLVKLEGPPAKNKDIDSGYKISDSPISSRSKSSYGLTGTKDYISVLEEDFPADIAPLKQQDLWNFERKKMLERLESGGEQGADGEVFDDDMLDSDPDDY